MSTSYLLFLLGERRFGVKMVGAKEIFAWRKPRPVPLAHSYVEGLIDYRGGIYPIFNLEQRIGLKRQGAIGFTAQEQIATAPYKGKSIILFEKDAARFGIIVDSVLKMLSIEEPKEALKKVLDLDPRYVRGVLKTEEHDVVLLDIERMINAD